MSLLPIKNTFGEKIVEVIPEREYGFLLHAPHIWVISMNAETRRIVEDVELIWILEKIDVFLDIAYRTLKVPCHPIQGGKKSCTRVIL